MENITKNFSDNVYMATCDQSVSYLPALNHVKGDRWIYIAFEKSVDSAGGLFEVNESSIEACDGGDAKHFETFSEVLKYVEMCHYPFTAEQLEEFKQMLVQMELYGPHLA